MTPEELKKIARDERAYRYACQLLGDGKVKNLKVEGEHSFSAQVEDAPYTYAVTATFTGGELSACTCTCKTPRGAPPRLRARRRALFGALARRPHAGLAEQGSPRKRRAGSFLV